MRAFILSVIIFLTGCGEPKGDFQTSQGWKVWTNDLEVSKESVETLADVLLTHLEHYDPMRFFKARQVVHKREPHLQYVADAPGAWGLTYDWGIVVWWQPCLEESATTHEMIHWYLRALGQEDDPDHQEKYLWEQILPVTNRSIRECGD